MAILDIKKAGDLVLKQQAQPIERIDKTIRTLLDVGEGLLELINPTIIRKEGTEIDTEGCLSVPEIYGEVERAAKVSVEYLNRRGKRHRITATGLLARCLQHEIDHLHGRLFIDIANNLHKAQK